MECLNGEESDRLVTLAEVYVFLSRSLIRCQAIPRFVSDATT